VLMPDNLAVGAVTPPMAVNLYVAANLAKITLEEISWAVIPFVLAMVGALLITTYFPILSLWIPKLFGRY
jgi:C4-dicarboxylate transporter DctM subunit